MRIKKKNQEYDRKKGYKTLTKDWKEQNNNTTNSENSASD